jgi:hypothetical protein
MTIEKILYTDFTDEHGLTMKNPCSSVKSVYKISGWFEVSFVR